MNILFLDIDGVICTDRAYYASQQDKHKSILRTWDPISIQMIDRIACEYDMHVVVSSTWRKIHDVPLLLLTHGFKAPFHKNEKTPYKFGETSRGHEIRMWIEDNEEDVENILIVDDSTDGITGTELEPFQVITSFEDGFLTQNYRDAERIMKAQVERKLKFELKW